MFERQESPHSASSAIAEFCRRGEWQESGLRPQKLEGAVKGRYGPDCTVIASIKPPANADHSIVLVAHRFEQVLIFAQLLRLR